jgi:hypothetical protein
LILSHVSFYQFLYFNLKMEKENLLIFRIYHLVILLIIIRDNENLSFTFLKLS